jgi:hypothetical protein
VRAADLHLNIVLTHDSNDQQNAERVLTREEEIVEMVDDECDGRTEDEIEEMLITRVVREMFTPHTSSDCIGSYGGVAVSVCVRFRCVRCWIIGGRRIHDPRIILDGSCGWRRVVNELREVWKVMRMEGG